MINTPFGRGPRTDGYFIRTAAARKGVPCITTMPGVLAVVQGVEALRAGWDLPRSLQEYHAGDRGAHPAEPGPTFASPAGGVRA